VAFVISSFVVVIEGKLVQTDVVVVDDVDVVDYVDDDDDVVVVVVDVVVVVVVVVVVDVDDVGGVAMRQLVVGKEFAVEVEMVRLIELLVLVDCIDYD